MAPTKEKLDKLAQMIKLAKGKLSYRDFEEKTGGRFRGVSHAQLRRLELCEIKQPGYLILSKLAPFLGFDKDELWQYLYEEPTPKNLDRPHDVEQILFLIKRLEIHDVAKVNELTSRMIADHFESLDSNSIG